MKKIINTLQGNQYIYSDFLRHFLFVPKSLGKVIQGNSVSNDENNYYIRKLKFLQEHHFFDEEKILFHTSYEEELVRQNIACLRQLLIEVTDSCNLKCKYCGYGEFYSNYDQRETCNQIFDNVKILIDYLANLWDSDYNVSHKNTVIIGFYGGEPLLNMELIREVVDYVEKMQIPNISFCYNMTTNAILLDRYMDFLVEKKFTLLISLDGGEYQSSYRVDKHGNPSFFKVVKNVDKLRKKYPSFFEKNVNFNAVLHDRNSAEECYRTIMNLFDKIPRISELSTNGIIPERINDFVKIFNSKLESFRIATKQKDIKEAFLFEDADSITFHTMLMNYVGNRYATYLDLFDSNQESRYLPTGTCKPFERKLFLTVSGKILPCEKIGQENVIARLSDGKLTLDCEAIAKYYSSMYKKVVKSCSHCYLKRNCGQCMFLLKEKDGQLLCPGIQTDSRLRKEFLTFLTYAEQNPERYEKLLSSIVVD